MKKIIMFIILMALLLCFTLTAASPRLMVQDANGVKTELGDVHLYKGESLLIVGEDVDGLTLNKVELSFESVKGNFDKYAPVINKILARNNLPPLEARGKAWYTSVEKNQALSDDAFAYELKMPVRPLVTEKFSGNLNAYYTDADGNQNSFSQEFLVTVHTDDITNTWTEENAIGASIVNTANDIIEGIALNVLE